MLKRLKLDDLEVESFSTGIPQGRGTVVGASDSLNNATQCNCSFWVNCTKECIEYSKATDFLACCG